jgi:hypothetical protein
VSPVTVRKSLLSLGSEPLVDSILVDSDLVRFRTVTASVGHVSPDEGIGTLAITFTVKIAHLAYCVPLLAGAMAARRWDSGVQRSDPKT